MVENSIKALLIEDDSDHVFIVREMVNELTFANLDLECADRLRAGIEALRRGNFDVVLLDLSLPDSRGLQTLTRLRDHAPGLPVVILSASDDETLAARAVQAGAQDYLVKGQFNSNLLGRAIRYAIERQRTEQRLRESEGRHRILFESTGEGILIADMDTKKFKYVNPAICTMLGYSEEELLRMSVYDIPPKDAVDRVISEFETHAQKENYFVSNMPCMRKDGTIIFTDVSTNRALVDGVECNIGFFRDVTERKRAEEAIQRHTHNLGERVKELNCLYRVAGLVVKSSLTSGDVFQETVRQIPPAWQYPEITCARITFDRQEFETEGFRETPWIQSADIAVDGEKAGTLEVCYLEERPEIDEGAFLKEERDLIDAIAGELTRLIERRHTEKARRESEEKFRSYVENAPDGVFVTDENGKYLEVNKAACLITGYSRAELLKKAIPDMIPSGFEECRAEHFDRVMAEGHASCEVPYLHSDGSLRYWSVDTVKISENRFLGFTKDITERMQAAEALRTSENRYQELFDSVIEGIGLVDENETILFCNPAYAMIFDEDSTENMIGKSLQDYIPEDQQDLILSQTEQRREGQCSQYELEIITAKGNKKTILASISPRRDEENNYLGAFGGVIDITETRRLREFAERAQRLETAGRIAGQVAHDFNNLLGPLTAYPELITNYMAENHPARRYVLAMEKAAEQMSDINQQLMTLGRRGHYNHEPMNLNEVVTQAIEQIHPVPETLVIKQELDENLMNINAGRSQIFRVVTNLLNNARDAMQDSGKLTIRTENYYVRKPLGIIVRVTEGEYVKLTISDTGCGIPAEILRRMFDPFFSTKTADSRRGSGLGLSVVHAVVEDHNGYIDCASVSDEGTSFYLYFPVTREGIDAPAKGDLVGGDERVLLVDDDQIQQEVTGHLLEELGYQVTLVKSGEKAVEELANHPFDLVVLDMVMPGGMDGTDTYKSMLEVNPSQKAIIVSGYAESKRVAEALNLGAGAFVRKPLTIKVLDQAVRKELARKAVAVTS